MRNFRNLEIWRLGMELVKLTYDHLKKLPKSEEYGLKSQMQRSAISMPSNIAEGCSRSSNKEVTKFFNISLGSAFELETQYLVCIMVGYLTEEELKFTMEKLTLFQKKTNTYISTLEQ